MQVKVCVSVPVGWSESEGGEAFELPADFSLQGITESGIECVAEAGTSGGRDKATKLVGECGGFRCATIAEGQVETDGEIGVSTGNLDGLWDVLFRNHQARLMQRSGAMIVLDRAVHFRTDAEVIAGDHDA